MMLDIYAALAAAAVLVLSLVALFCCCVYRTCCTRGTYSQKNLNQSEVVRQYVAQKSSVRNHTMLTCRIAAVKFAH